MKNENQIKPYSTIPRSIAEDYHDKKLQRNEWILLVWLRSISDPYGYATVNTTALRDDMFPNVKVNTVVQLLRSLRSKKYIYYKNHKGQRGSFRVEMDDWLVKDGAQKSIAHRFTDTEDKGESKTSKPTDIKPTPEPTHTLDAPTHRLDEMKSGLVSKFSMNSQGRGLTGIHNEHEPENQKENHENTLDNYEGRRTTVSAFVPRSYEEQRCAEIAKAVGEQYINPLLGVLRKDGYGLRIIEQAYGLYREDRQNGKRIDSPAAYFYGIIKKLKNPQ